MTVLALGLDGGGTQTRVLVEDVSGGARGEGWGGACNIAAAPVADAVHSVRIAIYRALEDLGAEAEEVRAVCAGVAGWSFAARRTEFHSHLQRLLPNAAVEVVPDYAIALAGATEGEPGVIVIAGTGSVAYGENALGHGHKAGGYGYLIDDAGSGYGVGRSALAAVLRAQDGTGDATALSAKICSAMDVTPGEIVAGVHGGGISRSAIASLAQVVGEAAGDGDAVARAILMRAGGALAVLAHGVTAAVFADAASGFSIAPVGGLWDAGKPLSEVFERSVRRFAPQAVVRPARQSPVAGALRRARRLLGGDAAAWA